MEFIYSNNLAGLMVGMATFIIIGIFHPIVIKAEYYFGVKCWWVFALVGCAGLIASLFFANVIVSVIFAVIGFSSFWSILEIFEQKKRVEKGWFPSNPKRKKI
ncbi:MAG: DUF4491 family protein [Paludibacter sp.]|nr:DUF4491 family protein [Paludibacter sp.]